jgi:hypothetical protein
MATTLLAKKSGPQDNAIATDDDHHEALASDPTVTQFPQGTTMANTSTGFGGGFGNATSSTTTSTSTFGAPASGGFGSTSSFGSPVSTGFGSSSSTGASAPGPSANGTVQVVHNQGESLKSGGGAMSEGGQSTVALDQGATDWINKKMRPMMGWVYMLTCTCDFVIFPVLWSVLQALSNGQVTSQWQPLTLQGAGLYHIAMGAVLGIAAYGRTKEKVAGVA